MKKMNLKAAKDSLTRSEMRSIMGGSGGTGCASRGEACYTANKSCCGGLTCVTCNAHRHDYCWS